MGLRARRVWTGVHTWTSLVCTGFLLMLCVTGLPLIFHDEIEAAFAGDAWQPANPDGPRLSYDALLESALARRPGEVPLYMSFDHDRPVVNVTTGPAPGAAPAQMHFASFDATSGAALPPSGEAGGVLDWLLALHTDMFLGLPGMLFLGSMGLAFVAAIVSGVVLYAPVMRKQAFGTVRRARTRRIRWLDTHDLLGIVTVAWASVVGLTGVVNTLETPIQEAWKARALADLVAPYEGQGTPTTLVSLTSLDAAISDALAAAPDKTLQFVAFPGGAYSTDHHLAVFLHGDTPLTERLIAPVLVDARTGAVAGQREMRWYAKGLALSRPLHFGDYGGLGLKLVWAVLDLFTIAVLATGLWLFADRRRRGLVRTERPLPGAPAAGA